MKFATLLEFGLVGWLALAPAGRVRAQWKQCDGPYSGNTTWLAADNKYIFAGTENDGILRSSDGGISWNKAGGGTFSHIKTANGVISAITPDVSYPYERIFTGITNDFFRSTDNGSTWENINYKFFHSRDTLFFSSPVVTSRALFVLESDQPYAGTVPYRSTDSGFTWTLLTQSALQSIFGVNDLVIAERYDGIWMRSSDQGSSWDTISWSNVTVTDMAESNAVIFVVTNHGILASTDSGLTWQERNNGLSSFNFTSISVAGDTSVVATIDSGIFVSTNDGISWAGMNLGLSTHAVTNVELIGGIFIARDSLPLFGDHTLSRSPSIDSSWSNLDDRWGTLGVSSLTSVADKMYAGTLLGIYSSTDSGQHWYLDKQLSEDTQVFYSKQGPYPGVGALGYCVLRKQGWFFVGSYEGIYRSLDLRNWELVMSGQNNALQPGIAGSFNFVSLDSFIFANPDGGLMMSGDFGQTWTSIRDFSPTDYGAFYIDTLNRCLIFGTDSGPTDTSIFVSTDLGRTWSSAFGIGDGHMVTATAVTEGTLFASSTYYMDGYFEGLYASSDYGLVWYSIDDGYGSDEARAMMSDFGYLFIGSSGVWRRPLSEMIVPSSVTEEAPAKQMISSFPNPFTQATKISFAMEHPQYAEVSIVNALGAEVTRLYSGELAAGNHSFSWDASGAAPGNYWCIVRMGGRVERVGLSRQ